VDTPLSFHIYEGDALKEGIVFIWRRAILIRSLIDCIDPLHFELLEGMPVLLHTILFAPWIGKCFLDFEGRFARISAERYGDLGT